MSSTLQWKTIVKVTAKKKTKFQFLNVSQTHRFRHDSINKKPYEVKKKQTRLLYNTFS